MSTPAAPDPVQRFRAKTLRLKIHPRERALLGFVAGQLVFLPWALGGIPLWSQWISLSLSLLAIVTALLPRTYDETTAPGRPPFQLYTWPKLLSFPPFWLGFTFLSYIVVQALNPSWEYLATAKFWWMRAIPHVAWLPSGVKAPIARGGPWRMLVIYTAVWWTVCAVWIGFTRRRSFQILFTVLAANAFCLACLGLAERALKADKIFWFWTPPAAYFVSSFTYKNHAGAYFDLLLALCAGLAFWHHQRSRRRHDKSSPSVIFAFFAAAIVLIVCFSYSRTATLLLFGYLIALLAIVGWRHFSAPSDREQHPLLVLLFVGVFGAFLLAGIRSVGITSFVEHMGELHQQLADPAPGSRTLAHEATWDMAKAKLSLGWGAGSFRFLFPTYQQKYPQIYNNPTGPRFYWEHAHNDYLEGLAENGLVGAALVSISLIYALVRIVRARAWVNPLALCVLGGAVLTLAHNTVDFNFYNPAVLTTWWFLVFAVIRWAELEKINSPSSA